MVVLPAGLSARLFPLTPACPGQYTHCFRTWMSTIDTPKSGLPINLFRRFYETLLPENLRKRRRERPVGKTESEIKLIIEQNSKPQARLVYTDGSVTNDQSGWGFTVKQGATTIHEDSTAYTVSTSSLTMETLSSTAVERAIAQCTSRWAMARGYRLNISIVLAAVHGLSGLFRAVSAVEPFTLSPPSHTVPVPNRPTRLCGRKATLNQTLTMEEEAVTHALRRTASRGDSLTTHSRH